MKSIILCLSASAFLLFRCSSPGINYDSENSIPPNQQPVDQNSLREFESVGLREESVTTERDKFSHGLKCMEEMGFYLGNELDKIDTNLTRLDLTSYTGLSADDDIVTNYNGVMSSSIHVKMKKPVGGNTFPEFWITHYLLGNEDEAIRYYENVLVKLQNFDLIHKEPYVDMLSGSSCYTVWTRAHSFYYDYMPQILDCIDPTGKRAVHLP